MHVEASPGPFEQVDVQALAIAVFKDEKPAEGFLKKLDELTNGFIKAAIESEEFTGKEGDTAYFHLIGNDKVKARRLLLVGAGHIQPSWGYSAAFPASFQDRAHSDRGTVKC